MKKKRLPKRGCLISAFIEVLVIRLRENGQYRTANAYLTIQRRLFAFAGKHLTFEHINAGLIEDFQRQLLKENRSKNTISFYMRNLRAIRNKAIERGLFNPRRSKQNPFKNVYIGIYQTEKRALTKAELSSLTLLRWTIGSGSSTLSSNIFKKAQLLFLFSFFARGMSFVDIAFLKKSDIENGTISYTRRKTGTTLYIGLTPQLEAIINYFEPQTQDSEYVFPILFIKKRTPLYIQYQTALRIQNERLKNLEKLCGITGHLSTHVARHTWATIAKNNNLSLAIISEGLGHRSERTTEIYLGLFDQSVLDEANNQICRTLQFTP